MNFEKFETNINYEDVKKEMPVVENFGKNLHEKKKSISPLSKYALVAIMGYLAGKGVENQIDTAYGIVDGLKQKSTLVETSVDESPYSDEFGSFKPAFPEDKSYEDALLLVEEVLSKDGFELSQENIDKLQLVKEALSESLEILDGVLSDSEVE